MTPVPSPNEWRASSTAPDLPPGHVHVWRIDLSRYPADLVGILEPAERTRAERIVRGSLRDQWIVCRASLRQILAVYTGSPAHAIQFETTSLGKPSLATGMNARQLPSFNISHSDCVALVAVAIGTPVGIDVERVRPLTDIDHLIERYFCAGERAELASLRGDGIERAFYRCWTRKEAVLKAAGLGLNAPLHEICVESGESPRPRVRSVPGVTASAPEPVPEPDRWTLVSLDPDPDFIAALAVPARVAAVHTWTWDHRD
jgi:4'-phosphopantetheinyl transferase